MECIIVGKEHLKKDGEELQSYLLFRRRGSVVDAKKGKGASYNRANKKQADYKARKQEIE
jgi:hypothetical protein